MNTKRRDLLKMTFAGLVGLFLPKPKPVRVVGMSQDAGYKIAVVDLGGKKSGTVFTVGFVTLKGEQKIIETFSGAYSADEVVKHMDAMFRRHEDLYRCLIATSGMQQLFVQEISGKPGLYPWWHKVIAVQTPLFFVKKDGLRGLCNKPV